MKTVFQEKYVVIDLETTGNQAKNGDRIIQIGLCTIENGQITDLYAALVNPLTIIPPFIEQLTGISNEEVEHAPTIEAILPEIVSRIEGAVLVAHIS